MHKKYLLLFFLLLSVALLYSCSKQNEKAQNKSVNPNSMQSINRKWMNIGKHITAKFIMCFITH